MPICTTNSNKHQITDQDGTVIARGMAAVFQGRIYVVGYAENAVFEPRKLVCLDGRSAEGRLERVLLAGFHLRRIHLLGYQLPLVW